MNNKTFDYIIVGAGIAGCSTAYFLSKYNKNILLIDRNCDVAQGASGVAGAFLSPLLGKANPFKDLVTKALKFSTSFYKKNIPSEIYNCGVVRIPKNDEDRKKFESYKSHMDFEYKEEDDGYFFDIGSQVNSYNICKFLSSDIEKLFKYEVKNIEKEGEYWLLNKELKTKNLILSTGADISLIDEKYFGIRAVWGQKIDVLTNTNVEKNYHKASSLSFSRKKGDKNLISIGATHHRIDIDLKTCNCCIKKDESSFNHEYGIKRLKEDCQTLLKNANDIKKLDDVEIIDMKIGARASSVDYFPMLGKLIDSSSTIKEYPHLVNGSFIKDEMLKSYDNLYVINGVGGRGFVLSPYLANMLVENIINGTEIDKNVITHRLFKRWVKKSKLKNC